MTDGVDNWVKTRRKLGKEGWQLRNERGDARLGADSGQEDDKGVGGPDAGPQQHVRHGNLRDLVLGAFGLIILVIKEIRNDYIFYYFKINSIFNFIFNQIPNH